MDFRRTREAAFLERQQRVLAMRCQHLLSKEESTLRHEIAGDSVAIMNRLEKDFLRGLVVLGYYRPLPNQQQQQPQFAAAVQSHQQNHLAAKAASDGNTFGGKHRGRGTHRSGGAGLFSTDADLASRLAKAGAMYSNGALRFARAGVLRRAHYQHHVPPDTRIEVLPPVPPYELRLIAVKEAGERELVTHAEADDRDRLRRHLEDVVSETRAREQRILSRLYVTHGPDAAYHNRGHLGGSSPSRLPPLVQHTSASPATSISTAATEKKKKKDAPVATAGTMPPSAKKSQTTSDTAAKPSPKSKRVTIAERTGDTSASDRNAASPQPKPSGGATAAMPAKPAQAQKQTALPMSEADAITMLQAVARRNEARIDVARRREARKAKAESSKSESVAVAASPVTEATSPS